MYCTTEEARSYFGERLDADAWNNASEQRQVQALATASRRIGMQRLRGNIDAEVPQPVKDATCEEALMLLTLTDWDKSREKQHALGVAGAHLGDASETSAQEAVLRKMAGQELLSPVAKRLMAPYLARGAAIV